MSSIPQGGAFDKALPATVRPATLGVRGGTLRSGFEETSEALYLNSGFVYESAEAAEAASPATSTISSTPATATPR